MKILKFTKLKNNQYKLTLDNKEEVKLYEDTILKENLLLTKEVTAKELERIIESNDYYVAYYKALKLIKNRLRSEKELKTLLGKNFTSNLIDSVIKTLKKEGYLNNKTYISSYIHDALVLTSKGPYKITKELLNMGFKEEEISSLLNQSEQIWQDRINKYISKKLNMTTNFSNQKLKLKLSQELINLGYDKDLINTTLSNLKLSSDKDNLIKDYHKIKSKLERKDSSYLEYKLVTKLLQKGYNYEDIKEVINNN